MAATALPVTSVTRSVAGGVDLTTALTAVDGVNGNSFVNDGSCLLRVKNGNAAACTVTVYFQGTVTPAIDGMALTTDKGRTYSVPATTGDRLIGPFPTSTYGTNVQVTFSVSATVTAGVYDPAY